MALELDKGVTYALTANLRALAEELRRASDLLCIIVAERLLPLHNLSELNVTTLPILRALKAVSVPRTLWAAPSCQASAASRSAPSI